MQEYRRIIHGADVYYGKHLIASGKKCAVGVRDIEHISAFLKMLPTAIEMVPFGAPLVERFGEGIEIGISGVQLIQTSAITIHTNDMACDLYLDVFSCKDFSEDVVLDEVRRHFSPASLDTQILYRK